MIENLTDIGIIIVSAAIASVTAWGIYAVAFIF